MNDQGVVVRPDQVSLGVLVTAVPRDAVDAAVAACGVGDRRAGGKLPAHVVAYLTMGLCLFREEDYGEVATKVTGALSRWGCWDASWSVPTAGGISQARKRLGRHVLAEVFERVAGPVADRSTRGAWLRGWRLLGIDGFEVDLPDTPGNAEGRQSRVGRSSAQSKATADRAQAAHESSPPVPAPRPAAQAPQTFAYHLRTDLPQHWLPLLPQRAHPTDPSMTHDVPPRRPPQPRPAATSRRSARTADC